MDSRALRSATLAVKFSSTFVLKLITRSMSGEMKGMISVSERVGSVETRAVVSSLSLGCQLFLLATRLTHEAETPISRLTILTSPACWSSRLKICASA